MGVYLSGSKTFFRSTTKSKQTISPGTKTKYKVHEEEKKAVLCFNCRNILTSSSEEIKVSGSHFHHFVNPAGIKYDLRCFSEAPGCMTKGTLISNFSWFPDYKWNFALCSNCSIHTGWFYNSGNDTFFGLISESIIGEY